MTGVRFSLRPCVEPCDIVVRGKGVTPRAELADGNGRGPRRGIPGGRVAAHAAPRRVGGGRRRASATDRVRGTPAVNALWPVAVEQGRLAGLNMAGARGALRGGLGRATPCASGTWHLVSAGIVRCAPRGEGFEVSSRAALRAPPLSARSSSATASWWASPRRSATGGRPPGGAPGGGRGRGRALRRPALRPPRSRRPLGRVRLRDASGRRLTIPFSDRYGKEPHHEDGRRRTRPMRRVHAVFRRLRRRPFRLQDALRGDLREAPARARASTWGPARGAFAFPNKCRHCDPAPCMRACMPRAITRDAVTGAVLVDPAAASTAACAPWPAPSASSATAADSRAPPARRWPSSATTAWSARSRARSRPAWRPARWGRSTFGDPNDAPARKTREVAREVSVRAGAGARKLPVRDAGGRAVARVGRSVRPQ